ncbi:TetR/AcrR family transcriptional regulator [Anaerocolumna sp. MB42-C2]|uniref:TetR/AcrR family transcriptional regulator n=1 Tax=Anaerocolumna sp. MB42-C2 TaxID=3070997 RepID=UPI0027E05CCB|nr:TetR/AcrR family transcriptional regulator [Anaerocolumna sp. MB42-C2]WMJ86868.1 TetR/AcrR family transcriptional regulator [Anaerocolumna sp. MB42-C2]
MPKVKPEYFYQKKDFILDAALNICKRKPLHQITMKDIIRESGISQGGIYRYYKNVDEILVEVMNKCCPTTDYKKIIDEILTGKTTSAEALKNLFDLLANYLNDNATTLGKFHFELTEMIAYEPDRINNVSAQNRHIDNIQYLMNQLYNVIRNGISAGEFQPVLLLNDILCFIATSIDGIVLNGILHKCYGMPEKEYGFDILNLMNTTFESVICLLSPHKKH